MVNRYFIIVALVLMMLTGCDGQKPEEISNYRRVPEFVHAVETGNNNSHLNPVRLQLKDDTIFATYAGMARIDKYSKDIGLLGTIELLDPEPVFPTDFAVTDSEIIVSDHSKNVIAVYDREGKFLESYGKLPDGETGMRPFSLTYFQGILYIGDIRLKKVLAIIMESSPGVTERGELIIEIPNDDLHRLEFPSAMIVTPDGRLLIGDAGSGRVDAYTCNGGYIYPFDSIPGIVKIGPQGFSIDNMIDPSMQDTASFDPSGIRAIGRIHMVDALSGQVHMFNPVGKFIASYPQDSTLEKPSDVIIDKTTNRVYVAEPARGRILIYRYED